MKKFTKVVEAYEMEMEKHDDFAEEHAKVVIASYLDGKLNGVSLQSAFAEMVEDNGLEEDGEELEHGQQAMVQEALINLAELILKQAGELELIKGEETASAEAGDVSKEDKENYLLKVIPTMSYGDKGELANLVDEFLDGDEMNVQGKDESDVDYILYHLANLDDATLNAMYSRAKNMSH